MDYSRVLPVLAVVIPCYNEEDVLPETIGRITQVLEELTRDRFIAEGSFLVCVDDGSKDRTWAIIEAHQRLNRRVAGIKLARNAGHQRALLAGLQSARARADCVVSIDADLQDDPEAIREFIAKFREGCDIVYGIRRSRGTDSAFKRHTAQWFYKLMRKLGADVEYNHADYRLMSRRALEQLDRFKEVNVFLRGIVPLIGFRSECVYYDRNERWAGESKYPLKKMLSFAWDGITSLSVTPIRLVTAAGFALFVLSLFAGVYAVVRKMTGNTVTGWASLMVSLWFVGGVQLISLGLIGEYIGKIYKEVKRRPLYVIEEDVPAQTEQIAVSGPFEQGGSGLSAGAGLNRRQVQEIR
ncbi:glycosyltransferase family 2 protein [Paenibacillus chartarius]|uniref:Glycosyltransferase family 2 protein n=1 Tax=Paenibacillus chartarius TaxID=747481 RepID=A0ABV6DGL6_9BACL